MAKDSLSFLDRQVFVKIDRPLGSQHPDWGFTYPINYGYVPGVLAADGDELDVYILGISQPVDTFNGRCIAVIHRLNDQDDKLIIAPEGADFSDEEIRELTRFQEKFFTSTILRPGSGN